MKTILVDAVHCLISKEGEIFEEMFKLLENYPNRKVVLTGADEGQFKKFHLDRVPYEIFTLKHDPEKTDPEYYKKLLSYLNLGPEDVLYFEHSRQAVESAQSVGITTYLYDNEAKDLVALKRFIDKNL